MRWNNVCCETRGVPWRAARVVKYWVVGTTAHMACHCFTPNAVSSHLTSFVPYWLTPQSLSSHTYRYTEQHGHRTPGGSRHPPTHNIRSPLPPQVRLSHRICSRWTCLSSLSMVVRLRRVPRPCDSLFLFLQCVLRYNRFWDLLCVSVSLALPSTRLLALGLAPKPHVVGLVIEPSERCERGPSQPSFSQAVA